MAVALGPEDPEGHEAEDVAVVVENPELVRMLREEVAVLRGLPLVPALLGLTPDGLVAVLAEHRDVALLDRPVALDGEIVDRVEVGLGGDAQDGVLPPTMIPLAPVTAAD